MLLEAKEYGASEPKCPSLWLLILLPPLPSPQSRLVADARRIAEAGQLTALVRFWCCGESRRWLQTPQAAACIGQENTTPASRSPTFLPKSLMRTWCCLRKSSVSAAEHGDSANGFKAPLLYQAGLTGRLPRFRTKARAAMRRLCWLSRMMAGYGYSAAWSPRGKASASTFATSAALSPCTWVSCSRKADGLSCCSR